MNATCSIKHLRQHTREILDLAETGNEILIIYRGKKRLEDTAFGIWADRKDIEKNSKEYVQKIRKGRYNDN